MPSSNTNVNGRFVPDLFDDEDTFPTAHSSAQPLNGQSGEEPEHAFAFASAAPPAATTAGKKSKKKGKKGGKANVGKPVEGEREAEAEGSPYATEVTPSPPKEHGVKLGEQVSGEVVVDEAVVPVGGEEAVFEEIVDRVSSPAPEPEPDLAPPPRLPHTKPIQAARTPPSRSAGLYSSPEQYSTPAGYRSNNGTAPSPLPTSTVHPPPLSRRESATHTSPRPRFIEPVAPPHKAQPHFYGVPDFGLMNFGQQKTVDQTSGGGKPAGSEGYCCTFDSFADSGDAVSGKKVRDALLVGSEGGLEVFRVLVNKFEVVGRLEGLRGSVVGAKVLPYTRVQGDGMERLRPLVAVVVHGAMVEEGRDGGGEDEAPGFYQTSVEVYSLQEQSHIATLYRSAPVAVEKPTLGHLASVPEPVGELSVDAKGRYVVVSSGRSGEVFVFSHASTAENPDARFRCVGKFWTSLQTSPVTAAGGGASSRPQSSSEGGQHAEDKEGVRHGVPVFSLSPRWLALMAPSTAAHVSIGGAPTALESNPSPPGLASHVAPPQPPISCDIAGVDAEGTWGRLTRQAAQGLVKYSHIGFEMGLQGWRELTNPAPQQTTGGQHSRGGSRGHEGFPPTMAPVDDPGRVVKEPAIVVLVDLDTLLEAEEVKPKYAPPPLSTFALQEGCNFLSLSSSGLRLLSVSRSGKVSTIWDLTQLCHGTARFGQTLSLPGRGEEEEEEGMAQGPCVRQMHRFERNSEAIVTDAAWARDDDMLAVLTSHGTVHLHEVPAKAASRKRKRRGESHAQSQPHTQNQSQQQAHAQPQRQSDKASPTVSVSAGLSPPSSNATTGWMGGGYGYLKSGLQSVSTQVNTVRSQSSMPSLTFAGFREITTSAGSAGGRAIAKGLGRGFEAARGGVGDLWVRDENKIRFAGLRWEGGAGGVGGAGGKAGGKVGGGGGLGVMAWVRGKEGSSLAVVCGGTVSLHPVLRFERRRREVVVRGLRHDRYGKESFALPLIRTAGEGAGGGAGKRDPCAAEGVHGFWSLRTTAPPSGLVVGSASGGASGVVPGEEAQAQHEVETNPPYCPFHVDPRVSIFAFDEGLENSQADLLTSHSRDEDSTLFHLRGHGLAGEDGGEDDPWLFGTPLPGNTKLNSSYHVDDFLTSGGLRDGGGSGGANIAWENSEDSGDDDDDLANQVESRLTVRGEGGEVRVHSRRKVSAGGRGEGEGLGIDE